MDGDAFNGFNRIQGCENRLIYKNKINFLMSSFSSPNNSAEFANVFNDYSLDRTFQFLDIFKREKVLS